MQWTVDGHCALEKDIGDEGLIMVFSEFAKVRPWRVVASAMIICVLLWVAATIGPQAEGAGPSSAKVSARGDHVQR